MSLPALIIPPPNDNDELANCQRSPNRFKHSASVPQMPQQRDNGDFPAGPSLARLTVSQCETYPDAPPKPAASLDVPDQQQLPQQPSQQVLTPAASSPTEVTPLNTPASPLLSLSVSPRRSRKAKGKQPAKRQSTILRRSSSDEDTLSTSASSESDSDTDDSEGAASPRKASLSHSANGAGPSSKWVAGTFISSSTGAPPPPPPPPPATRGNRKYTVNVKVKVSKGPCEPVLCKICYESYDKLEQLYSFDKCGHKYCRECLQDFLNTHINEGAVLDLTCPFPDCETEITPIDVRNLVNPDTFSKYERFVVIASLRMDPNARWCPSPNCTNVIKADPKIQWVFCPECKFEFCFNCMAERHDSAPCGKEALAFLEKKRASETAAQKLFDDFVVDRKAFVKPCPACKTFIEKNDGCNHMTCGNASCKQQFCWLCLSLYQPDHFADERNFPDCYERQYYTPADMMAPPAPARYRPPRRRRIARVAKKVGIYVGVGVAVVTLGVPAAVIGGPVYGCFQLHKMLKARRREHAIRQRYADFVPPSAQRIAEASAEAARFRLLEEEMQRERWAAQAAANAH